MEFISQCIGLYILSSYSGSIFNHSLTAHFFNLVAIRGFTSTDSSIPLNENLEGGIGKFIS